MKSKLKKFLKSIYTSPIADILLTPFVFVSGLILYLVRRIGLGHLTTSKAALLKIGVMPIRNHYYEPLFDERNLSRPLTEDRKLPGINWNSEEQLALLNAFHFSDEFANIPDEYQDELTFHFNNKSFLSGDAEYLYNLVRLKKPRTIVEIGCGNSTKIAQLAIKKNMVELAGYTCEHICIEPYEMPWLEKLGIQVIRKRVEDNNSAVFDKLEDGDLLFIDSSHMIRPQGDVLFEFLELLPSLKKGVMVHVHDIFSPKDYPKSWIVDEVRLWNEQYLLEAFLTSNTDWKIIGALNFLRHRYYDALKAKCPRLTPDREPGSFYMVKVGDEMFA